MREKFIELSTKWIYTWPAWVRVFLSVTSAFRFNFALYTLVYYSPVILASALFATGHWQGCFAGLLFAFMPMSEYLYNEWLIKYKGMVIYHNWNPWVFTVIVSVYYIFMGRICWKERKEIE